MRSESRQFVRRAQLLFLITLVFPYFVLIADPEMMARLGVMRVEESRLRWIAISRAIFALVLVTLVAFSWWKQRWLREALGFVAVSSTVNLLTDLPVINQLGLEDPSPFFVFLFFLRALLSLLAVSLYLDFNSAPKDMRLSKTVLALRLPKTPSKEKPAIHDTTID
jgi:hypothetical protein